jgi:hypothetical protein
MWQLVVAMIIIVLILMYLMPRSENASVLVHDGPAWSSATNLVGWEVADPRTFSNVLSRTVGGQSAGASEDMAGIPIYDDNTENHVTAPWYDDNTERFTAAIEDDGFGYF